MDEELLKLIPALKQQLDAQTFDALLRVGSKLDRYRRIITVWEVAGEEILPIKVYLDLNIVVMKIKHYENLLRKRNEGQ